MTPFIMASAAVVLMTIPHSSPSRHRPSIELQCYDQGTDLGIQKFTCYRQLDDAKKQKEETDWSCRFSFFENGTKGRRQKLYCKSSKTGNHKLVYGDFL
ncbi:hypothetical protein P10VF_227 [Rhizobium phage vB_RleM_P10VF]|uniref:Uncharacterized protein n=1 Tax=Rhizobium phage vB_RleM_P10VF TaxID=1527770 RepID=A0A076YM13_9CAUD|nr:hypothetical protein P10VF_227 [Rhizobium phage vB_RleM_P10VF]AIK68440.1 hypothetical protein P10VF_227 [Rhizobium phage vB_RleM_P10VF]